MRIAALAAAAAIAASLAATTAAHAEPALVEPAPERPAVPAIAAYLEPGVAVGGVRDGLYGALHLDGGHVLFGPLWLHARFAQGGVADINLAGSSAPQLSSFTEARLGLEVRGCREGGHFCLLGGIDAGYALESFDRTGDMSSAGAAVATATARLGFDVGSAPMRLRTSVEAARGQGGWRTGGLTIGVARTW